MKTKKVLNIKPQEICEGDEHYVRYKGCDGRMHELPTHTVTHHEKPTAMYIAEIVTHHPLNMEAELTSPEARAVYQASFPNAIEVKDILVIRATFGSNMNQRVFSFEPTPHGGGDPPFPHRYEVDGDEILHFIKDGQQADSVDINFLEDDETIPQVVSFFQRTLDSIKSELTPKRWLYFITRLTRINLQAEFDMVEKHLYVCDRQKRTYDASVLTPVEIVTNKIQEP